MRWEEKHIGGYTTHTYRDELDDSFVATITSSILSISIQDVRSLKVSATFEDFETAVAIVTDFRSRIETPVDVNSVVRRAAVAGFDVSHDSYYVEARDSLMTYVEIRKRGDDSNFVFVFGPSQTVSCDDLLRVAARAFDSVFNH